MQQLFDNSERPTLNSWTSKKGKIYKIMTWKTHSTFVEHNCQSRQNDVDIKALEAFRTPKRHDEERTSS